MAMTEHEGLQIYKDASGNSFILYPITKAHLVDGFDEAVMALAGIEDGLAKFAHAHAAGDIKTGVLPIARGGTGANTAAAALEALGVPAAISAFGAARVEVGSYVGTGKYGASNPCSYTASFPPKVLFVREKCSQYAANAIVFCTNAGESFEYGGYIGFVENHMQISNAYTSKSGNEVRWYITDRANSNYVTQKMQCNATGATYDVIAIG